MNRLYNILEHIFQEKHLDLKKISKTIKELSNIFNAEELPEKEYMSKEWGHWAYLFYFYPINVYKYMTILNYHKNIFANKKTFFDFGAGPLTLFTAIALSGSKTDVLYAFDNSHEALEIGNNIINKIDASFSNKIKLLFNRPYKIYQAVDTINLAEIDVFSFGNVLCEMDEDERTYLLDKYLMGSLEKEKLVLILEPGTYKSFNKLKEIEKRLQEAGYKKLNDCQIDNCPMKGKDWCHENIKFPRNVLIQQIENLNGLDNKFVNFCYLLMSNKKNEMKPFTKNMYRVVSNLIEHKGLYLLHLCGGDGVYQFELQKKDVTDINKNFTLLKRGDIVKVNGTIEKGGRFRLNKGSVIEIVKKFCL